MKIPDNLAEMYATLTAKRPEMVVDGLMWFPSRKIRVGVGGYQSQTMDSEAHWGRVFQSHYRNADEAAALIRSHWEDELPDGRWLDKAQDEPHRATYSICSASWNEDEDSLVIGDYVPRFDDPITALYHYHMGRGA